MSRWETQVQLLNHEFKQPVGTYLIRLTDQIPNGYCLSVKCHTENSVYNDYDVGHYRIEVDPVSFQYHGLGQIFRSLDDLINTNCRKFNFDSYGVCSVFGLTKLFCQIG